MRESTVPRVATPRDIREVSSAPPLYRIIALSAWAAVLCLAGLAVAARAFVALLFTPGLPWWFEPAVTVVGVSGITLTIFALAAIRHRILPWLLLPVATGALAVVLLLTRAATREARTY